ncbi:ATPase [Basidiobolus ranarum]|uniref:ATPase n=1 Tax=Basidiobolus ranarum TaxID=34480 RepID=A0ABR2VQ82_9FUNG
MLSFTRYISKSGLRSSTSSFKPGNIRNWCGNSNSFIAPFVVRTASRTASIRFFNSGPENALNPTDTIESVNPSVSRSSVSENDSPIAAYNKLVASGVVNDDSFQRSIVQLLEDLHEQLRTYHPEQAPVVQSSYFSKWFDNKSSSQSAAPKGLYL